MKTEIITTRFKRTTTKRYYHDGKLRAILCVTESPLSRLKNN